MPAHPSSARPARSKYGAVKTQIDGHIFASKAESKRYLQLKELERLGQIESLELQPKYELAPSVRYAAATRATPALRYLGDFRYRDGLGAVVVEDVKGGPTTEGFRIKKHLLMAIHGIEVKEVRMR